MSTTVSGTTSTAVSDLTNQLFTALDTNGDNQLSAAEFRSFLTQLLTGVAAAGKTAATGTSGLTTAAGNNIQSGEDPQSYLLRLLNSGQFSNPQDAIDIYNAQNIPGNHYGTSPAYYPENDTIGLPTYYLIHSGGEWTPVQR